MGGVVAGAAFSAGGKHGSASAFAVPSDNCARCHRTGQRRRGAHCRERVRLVKRQMRCARIQRCDMGTASNKLRSQCARYARYRCRTTTLSRRQVATLRRRAAHSSRPWENAAPALPAARSHVVDAPRGGDVGCSKGREPDSACAQRRSALSAQRSAPQHFTLQPIYREGKRLATKNGEAGRNPRRRGAGGTPSGAMTCLRRTVRSPSPARPRGRSPPGSSAGGGRSR